jgi:tRNA threonylcarbamoyladenosine biosynthesis protein TsaE
MERVPFAELPLLAQRVLTALTASSEHAAIIALRGDLGAGKTTLTQALARELGVAETLQSPTYVLMKRYDISNQTKVAFRTLVHIDAYRLEKPEEFSALKPEQFLNDPACLVVVEWPEKLGAALPPANLTITLSSEGTAEGERFVKMQK